jgi:thiamine biosynthesis lipoprotein
VDLNAVAPGYAVDLLAVELTQLGLADFMIEIGGEVRVQGRNVQGKPWRIAVEKPVDAEPEPLLVLELADVAVTTSGEYRHYDIREGKRYSHTIDPRSGAPVEHELAAVVVVSSTALRADAWATALNVLGEREGYALAEEQGVAALFVTRRAGAWIQRATPAFAPYLPVARAGGAPASAGARRG